MNRIFTLLVLCMLSYIQIYGQNPVQVFSPNAAELGKYGQVPVNYFNGLANISIPITTFKASGYELPIYLSYYASGNKPDFHPGWVGLGWTLHAGGTINRIVNGDKDEKSEKEYSYFSSVELILEPGYYYNAEDFQKEDLNDKEKIIEWTGKFLPYRFAGSEPDEFMINVDDIQASFYITGNGRVKIKSKTNIDFKVDIRLNQSNSTSILYKGPWADKDLKGMRFSYIEEIVITKNDGIKYYFGGDETAIEFSFRQYPIYVFEQQQPKNTNVWRAIGTANSWLLKKIEIPNGEIVNFEYEKKGIPVIMSDSHTEMYYVLESDPINGVFHNTRQRPFLYDNISFLFIQPSYLSSIRSLKTGNKIEFKKSESTELRYDIKEDIFKHKIGDFSHQKELSFANLMAQNYYMQLHEIVENNKKVKLEYSNSPQTRLKLLSISLLNTNNQKIYSYGLQYNSEPLPPYNAKKTDKWGYYNNKYFGEVAYENLNAYRTADRNYLKAEILEKIIYPTGGHSEFVYEAHDYSKVATQFDFSVIPQTGIAGGLRIKEIVNYDGENSNSRKFEYNDNQGKSSGILSGIPLYQINGRHAVDWHYGQWWGSVYRQDDITYDADYSIKQEDYLNQLSTTNGNHITYSRVVEKLSDGSKTVYTYSNHEQFMDQLPESSLDNFNSELLTNTFTSREIERGLLMHTEYQDAKGRILRTEEYTYDSNPNRYNDFVKSISQLNYFDALFRNTYVKLYTFTPYLVSKKTALYNTVGMNPVETISCYEYNQHKLLSKTTTTIRDGEEEIEQICYSSDMLRGDYLNMKEAYMLSFPVEKIKMRNQHVVCSELSTYRKNSENNDYVLDKTYKAQLSNPVPSYKFLKFNGEFKSKYYDDTPDVEYTEYDKNSNLEGTVINGANKSTYVWGYDGQYPVAIFKNAINDYKETPQYRDVSRYQRVELTYNPIGSNEQEFSINVAKENSTIYFSLQGAIGENWYIAGAIDNDKSFKLVQVRSAVKSPQWVNYQASYRSSIELPIAVGHHTVKIIVLDAYKESAGGIYDGTLTFSYWDKESIDPLITGSYNVFYENFESQGSAQIVPFGFHSDKSYSGPYTISLSTDPNKSYTIDYQVFRNNTWSYVSHDFIQGTHTVNEGDSPVDDVRVYPKDAIPNSFNYIPFVGVRSKTDEKGMTETYEYDDAGRLIRIKDHDQHIIKSFDYNYYNQNQ